MLSFIFTLTFCGGKKLIESTIINFFLFLFLVFVTIIMKMSGLVKEFWNFIEVIYNKTWLKFSNNFCRLILHQKSFFSKCQKFSSTLELISSSKNSWFFSKAWITWKSVEKVTNDFWQTIKILSARWRRVFWSTKTFCENV